LLPGWKRKVSDFFNKDLSAEQVAGQAADQWREEGREAGREEGKAALRAILERQARRRFGEAALPHDLAARLEQYTVSQLTGLEESLADNPALEDWLDSFPTPKG
jgi:DNA-binding TFAR19-related protein (PDSD5 family)